MYPDYPDPMPDFQYLGGDHGKGLLESALAQPAQTFYGRFLYRTIFDKAAVLMCSMIRNHPFQDGNKRMGLTTTMVFLILNRYLFYAPTEEAVEQCVDIAVGGPGTEPSEIARWLRARTLSFDKYRATSSSEQESWIGSLNLPGGNAALTLTSLEDMMDDIEEGLSEAGLR